MPNGEEDGGVKSPLSETDLEDINRSLKRLDEAKALMRQSRQAGIDVDAFENRARETEEKLRRVKQAFFPGR